VTVWQAAARHRGLSPRPVVVWFLALIGYGVLDETTQPLAGRSCELGDWLADVSGAVLGMLLMTLCVLCALRMEANAKTPA
jgi:VanZ family protein